MHLLNKFFKILYQEKKNLEQYKKNMPNINLQWEKK